VRTGALIVESADDETHGALLRVPVTVRVPLGDGEVATGVAQAHAGGASRHYFRADSGRGLHIEVSTLTADGLALVAVHEPGGQPYREVSIFPAGNGAAAGRLDIDARDVQPGWYEVVVLAPPTSGVAARVNVRRAPVELMVRADAGSLLLDARNVADREVEVRLRAAATGAEWRSRASGNASRPGAIAVPVPPWAATLALDVTMPQDAWSRFTDFGVTLRRRDGRILQEAPLDYAFGRVRLEVPPDLRGDTLELALLPAAAQAEPATPWEVSVAARFYAAEAVPVDHGGAPRAVLEEQRVRRVRFPFERWPVQVPEGWLPLVSLIAMEGDAGIWTREVALPPLDKGVP
jgi:hypothetical protein